MEIPPRKFGIIIALLPLLCLFLFSMTSFIQPKSLSQKLEELRDAKKLNENYNPLIWNMATKILEALDIGTVVGINNQPVTEGLGIYVVQEEDSRISSNLVCNCAYSEVDKIILCDSELFKYMENILNSNTVSRASNLSDAEYGLIIDERNTKYKFELVRWVIGHELAHYLLSQDGISKKFGLLSNSEKSADLLYLKSIHSQDLMVNTYQTFSSLATTLYLYHLNENLNRNGLEALELIDLYVRAPATKRKVKISASSSHPPLLVRVLDLLIQIREYDEEMDSTDFFDWLRSNVEIEKVKSEIGTLCEYDYAPRLDETVMRLKGKLPDELSVSAGMSNAHQAYRATNYLHSMELLNEVINIVNTSTEEISSRESVLGSAYLMMGKISYILRDYPRATEYFNSSKVDSPFSAVADNFIAHIEIEKGDVEDAHRRLIKVVNEFGPDIDAVAGIAITNYMAGNIQVAKSHYADVVKFDQNFENLDFLQYELLWQEKALEAAQELLKQRY